MGRSAPKHRAPFYLSTGRTPSSTHLGLEWPPPSEPPAGNGIIWHFNLADALVRLDPQLYPPAWYDYATDVLDGIPVAVLLDRLARYAEQVLHWEQPVGHDPMRYGVFSAVPRWCEILLGRMRDEARRHRAGAFPRGTIQQVHWRHAERIRAWPGVRRWSPPARRGEPYELTRARGVLAAVVRIAYANPPEPWGRRRPSLPQLDPRWHWVIHEPAGRGAATPEEAIA